jgi:FkbM family methyltransferase
MMLRMQPIELAALRASARLMGELPDHMGQFRVAQWYWWRRRPGHRTLPQRLADGTRLELDLGDRTQALAYLTRRYCDRLVGQITTGLPPGGLFFDVGANVGLVTFQVANRRPDVRIVAFEPNPPAVAAWERNRKLCVSQLVTLTDAAVTDGVGTVTFDAPSCDLGAGRAVTAGGGVEVSTTTLDHYCSSQSIDRIDVVKVDVEGSEAKVLVGARRLLAAGKIRLLIVEFNDDHLSAGGESRPVMVQWLADRGMVPRGWIGDDFAFVPGG